MDLSGKKGLIVGVANRHSIAYGCAQVLNALGAEFYLSYLNEKAKPYVEPLAEELGAKLVALDVSSQQQMDSVFNELKSEWGEIDFVIHSVAWSPLDELHGRLVDTSAEGFAKAMDISCHSFIRMAKCSEPLMSNGGTLLTMSYYGSEKVVHNYDMMGPIKAALESSVRYLAAELGSKSIRVHGISPGPMLTRAASGITEFDQLMDSAIQQSPLHQLGTPEDVGNLAAFLISDYAKKLTGSIEYVDAGHHIMA